MDFIATRINEQYQHRGQPRALCYNISRRRFLVGISALAAIGPRVFAGSQRGGDVVVVRGVRFNDALRAPEFARRLISESIGRLTGAKRTEKALERLLPADKRYSIKIDSVSPLASTSSYVIEAMLALAYDRGVQPWDVTVWDGRIADVRGVGYDIRTRHGTLDIVAAKKSNRPEPGGYIDQTFTAVAGEDGVIETRLAHCIADGSPAVINLPALRHHPVSGFSGALVSLAMGAIEDPGRFQTDLEGLLAAVVSTWKQPALAGHLLTVMDAGSVVFEGGPVGLPGWAAREDALIIGFDPVAVDAAALPIIERLRAEKSLPSLAEPATTMLQAAEDAGIGSATPQIIYLNAEQL